MPFRIILEEVDQWVRIFIWTCDINKQGLVIVKWNQGGFSLNFSKSLLRQDRLNKSYFEV